MANLLNKKGSKTRILNTFPSKSFGKDGDIVISKILNKGVFLCTKADGMWYSANKLEELKKNDRAIIPNIKTNSISIDKLINSENIPSRILISDNNIVKYRTKEQLSNDLGVEINDIDYKTAYCSLGQYTDKNSCEEAGGTWYYSENDSHDSISSTAENQLLTVGQSIGSVDAEPTLLYDGSTLEIKRNTNYDDNWQTSAQDNLLKLTYDSNNSGYIGLDSSGNMNFKVGDDKYFTFFDAENQNRLRINTETAVLRITSPDSLTNNCSIDVDSNAATSIVTTDFGGAAGHLTLDIDGDIILDSATGITKFYLAGDTDDLCTLTVAANGQTTIATADSDGTAGNLVLQPDGELVFNVKNGRVSFYDSDNLSDYARFDIGSDGGLQITIVDSAISGADFVVDADGDIILDSHNGKFEAKKAGTEFSSAGSAYAGMILGYTDIGLNETHANVALTTSFAVPTDEHSVTFTAPPSGNVEIWCQFGQMYLGSSGAGDLYAGLSTANATDGYSALASYHEEGINNGNIRYGFFTPSNSWTLTGLTAGTSYTYWVGVKSSSTSGTPRLYWGGNSSLRYPDFIMKAIALPATIAT